MVELSRKGLLHSSGKPKPTRSAPAPRRLQGPDDLNVSYGWYDLMKRPELNPGRAGAVSKGFDVALAYIAGAAGGKSVTSVSAGEHYGKKNPKPGKPAAKVPVWADGGAFTPEVVASTKRAKEAYFNATVRPVVTAERFATSYGRSVAGSTVWACSGAGLS